MTEIWWLNCQPRRQTAALEPGRGAWNCRCSGEMRRDRQEHQGGSQRTGPEL